MKKKISLCLEALLLVVVSNSLFAATFTESFVQLRTPGLGYQESVNAMPTQAQLDSCNFDDNHSNMTNAGLKSGSKYVRMVWQEFEPSDDDFQFAKLDQLIQCAFVEGKSVDLRVMLSWPGNYTGPEGLPQWLINKGINETYDTSGVSIPDWDNQIFLDEHAELIYALGNRYDGHKDVSSIDIGSVGYFGEWHYYPDNYLLPSLSRMREIVDLYYAAFPDTPKVPLEGAYSESGYDSTISNYLKNKPDLAWRGDSWGAQELPDYPDYFNKRYNTLHNMIPDAWKDGMVVLEISGNGMDTWPANPDISDLSSSIAYATTWGASQIHTKHGGFPQQYRADLIALEKKLGFRFVLRNANHESSIPAGSTLNVSMNWDNVGIAPSYRDFRIAFRLRNSSNGRVIDADITPVSVKGWLPGSPENVRVAYNLSSQVTPGTYTLDAALVFHNSLETLLPIAVTESRADGWVPLGSVNVSSASDPSLAPAGDVTVSEAAGTATVELVLSEASSETVSVVAFTQQANSARPGADYYGLSRRITFAPGETSKTVGIAIVDDAVAEDEEFLRLRLGNAENAEISTDPDAPTVAVVTITDDDAASSLPSINVEQGVMVNESDGTATVKVSLSQASVDTVTVLAFTQMAGAAMGGVDYFGFTVPVEFAPGETSKDVLITIVDDAIAEQDETFWLRLTNAVNGRISPDPANPSAGTITIVDDD